VLPKLLVSLLYIAVLFSVKALAEVKTDQLDIFSDKPLKQLYFRYTEGSLRNMPEAAWMKRWSRFDGIVLKAYGEEGAPFTQKERDTLKRYKQTFPEKALLLHFNGRARDPLFQPIQGTARDFLYFGGTKNKSAIYSNEVISKIYVEKAGVFRRMRELPDGVYDDIVLVKVDSKNRLDWTQFEHAKVIEVNFDNRFIKVKRDITSVGKIAGKPGQVHIAMHAAKGPFFAANKQRLWEYNWFAALDKEAKENTLQTSLVNFLATELLTNSRFFDGVSIDVLTETRSSRVFGYSTLLDLDQDGKGDTPSEEFDHLHSLAIYQFLEKLRFRLSTDKLIIADGASVNQRAVGLLNGIESEGWPNFRDPEIKQWSSGLNRQRYWNEFGQSPQFSYFKLAEYLDEQNKKIIPTRSARRLAIAGAILTGAAISPAHRPNGVPFHKWPEFRELRNLGKAIGEIQSIRDSTPLQLITEGKASQLLRKHLISKHRFAEIENLIEFQDVSAQNPLCLQIDVSGDMTIDIEAKVKPQNLLPSWRPLSLSISSERNNQPLMGFLGQEMFDVSFYFADFEQGKACITLDYPTTISINNLQVYNSTDVRLRLFENAIVIANPSNKPIKLNKEMFAHLSNSSTYADKLHNVTLPASDYSVLRF
jgi:hypothetical protein